MRNPNFLVLDEPTNDLDIKTLQTLEEYLQDFPGCVIVVSHDRYFMDKVVDHLLVFKGGGELQDFPGNYTQYRQWSKLQTREKAEEAKSKRQKGDAAGSKATAQGGDTRRRMTYKERLELQQTEKDIAALTKEKEAIEQQLSTGTISVEQITELSKRLSSLLATLDAKELRWLELSELEA